MNDTNIDTHNSLSRTLQEMNTSWQHTHIASCIKAELTTQNVQKSYTQHQCKTNMQTEHKWHYSYSDRMTLYNMQYSPLKQNTNVTFYYVLQIQYNHGMIF